METEKIGLKKRPRNDGTIAYYWVASAVSRHSKDYPQKTVRVHGATMDEITARCRVLTSELKQWLSQRGAGEPVQYDGKLRTLIRMYRTNPASPYFEIKRVTRDNYDQSLNLIDQFCGMRRLDKVTGLDIKGWYNELKKAPEDTEKKAKQRAKAAEEGRTLAESKPRPRRAYQCMQLLRIVIGFGVVSNISECFRLKSVLEEMRFNVPAARTESITFGQVKAICDKAISKGLYSVALAQALQFELTLRQVDVIGVWEKIEDSHFSGIIYRGKRWQDGLLWSHLSADGILQKATTKVDGVDLLHDTTQYPFLRQIMDSVPLSKRIGPMIISEATGLPYQRRYFAAVWRKIASEVGVPNDVWNRDSRAGGVTEGSDAGADIEHLKHHANHTNSSTTQRYNRRTLQKTRSVAQLRVAQRSAVNETKSDG
ncbi:site-specific integrase [Rhizobium sp. 18055]|uniref:site-specific integrase n=1 Tax=Rhizobium sp. 18055 TaxID=2681403 RepID=UPI001357018E|nr:site-specific integrase [Rhizobium sp. 18055]